MKENHIISKLESILPLLSDTEQRLGNYILDNRRAILNMTTKELAMNSNVSEATVIRFSRKLGVKGYSEFKIALSADLVLNNENDMPLDTIDLNDSPLTVYQKLASYTVTSIHETGKVLDEEQLTKAVNLIYDTFRRGNRIYLGGQGASSILARELQIRLMRLNIPSIYYEDSHLQLESNLNISENDLFICFTTLGKSRHTHDYIHIANEKKANILLITQYGNLKLAKQATVTLFTSCVENNFRLASQTAQIVQTMIVDTLFLLLALKNLPQIRREVKKTKEVFEELNYYVL